MQFKQSVHPLVLSSRKKHDLKHIQLGQKLAKNCDRDSAVKICLQLGLGAQKVEKHHDLK